MRLTTQDKAPADDLPRGMVATLLKMTVKDTM